MKYLRLLVLPLFASPLLADESRSGAQHTIFMSENGVVVLELQIQIEGKSPQQFFQKYVDDLMVSIDTDHDGIVTADEARGKYLTPKDAIQAQLIPVNGSFAAEMTPDASPKDGVISRQEFLTYFKRIGLNGFLTVYQPRMMPVGGNRRVRQVGSATDIPLFARLDTNADAKLSPVELLDALKTLRKLDLDDDETISAAELSPIANGNVIVPAQTNAQSASMSPFLGAGSEESLPKQVRRLIEKYDSNDRVKSGVEGSKSRNQKLSRLELGLPEEIFKRFDLDGDQQLDFDELRQFITSPEPTITIRVSLDSHEPLAAISNQSEFQEKLRSTPDGAANINLDTTILSIDRGSSSNLGTAEALLKPQFMAADRDSNGYLEKSEVERAFLFGTTFENLDTDMNGKVYLDEAVAYFKIRFDAARSRTVLLISEQGRTLFEILDTDGDRRLSSRELKLAADRLSLWDKDGDGLLSESEVPLQFRLTVSRGNLAALGGNFGTSTVRTAADVTSGPVWFVKMDKNRDGEVSHREFLGDLDTFDKLDRNHDGFIDLTESVQVLEAANE